MSCAEQEVGKPRRGPRLQRVTEAQLQIELNVSQLFRNEPAAHVQLLGRQHGDLSTSQLPEAAVVESDSKRPSKGVGSVSV